MSISWSECTMCCINLTASVLSTSDFEEILDVQNLLGLKVKRKKKQNSRISNLFHLIIHQVIHSFVYRCWLFNVVNLLTIEWIYTLLKEDRTTASLHNTLLVKSYAGYDRIARGPDLISLEAGHYLVIFK